MLRWRQQMKQIEVEILRCDFDQMPKFLARLTQRGHLISSLEDVNKLYDDCVCNDEPISKKLATIPHDTIRRMNYLTVCVTGLSTKAVSQLRTHAKRLTFLSTSTQYSSFDQRKDNFVMPPCAKVDDRLQIEAYYEIIETAYKKLLSKGVDKDIASYILPQGLRKTLIISGNWSDWQYVMRTRLCNRNTKEVQYIMELIAKEIIKNCGKEYIEGMLPNCVDGKCQEGDLSCKKKYDADKIYKV